MRLLQLSSSSLPVGAFSYSQGMEAAAEAGIVRDASSAEQWIRDLIAPMRDLDAPLWLRCFRAWRENGEGVTTWNDVVLATRETAELRAETVQMGYSLRRLLLDLGDAGGVSATRRGVAVALEEPSYLAMHALACASWGLDEEPALEALLWSWLEHLVMAAVRIVPLGQTDGQRLLLALGEALPAAARTAMAIDDSELGAFSPGLAWLSSQHETQYTRIFRS